MATKRLLAEEFDVLVPLLDKSDERIAAARLVLVDGWTFQAAAEKYGWSKQNVYYAVDSVFALHGKFLKALAIQHENSLAPLPPGWERVEIDAPSDLLAKFSKQVERARKKAVKAAGEKDEN